MCQLLHCVRTCFRDTTCFRCRILGVCEPITVNFLILFFAVCDFDFARVTDCIKVCVHKKNSIQLPLPSINTIRCDQSNFSQQYYVHFHFSKSNLISPLVIQTLLCVLFQQISFVLALHFFRAKAKKSGSCIHIPHTPVP